MKRAKIIAAIENELCGALLEDYREPDGSWDTHKVAELILDRIEAEGMRSPDYEPGIIGENLGRTGWDEYDKDS